MKAENARDKMAQLRADIDSTIRKHIETSGAIRLWDGERESSIELPSYITTDKHGAFRIMFYITDVYIDANNNEIVCQLMNPDTLTGAGTEHAFWLSLEELIDLLDAIEYTVSN